ncbi:MAG: putative N-acetylmannosamine-6-phosphate 2-epimerase [Trueperaceae bacterium]
MDRILEQLRHSLIVSCQPQAPLDSPAYVADLAAVMVESGAAGIRANGAERVRTIRTRIGSPIIGINKQRHEGFQVFITPTIASAREVVDAGADIVALDGADAPRPDGSTLRELIASVHERGARVMADISTVEEGVAAAEAGADLIGTTLSGYTPYSPQQEGADLDLVAALSEAGLPVVAEGRYNTSVLVEAAFERGAFAVVVGRAITEPRVVVQPFLTVVAARGRVALRGESGTRLPDDNEAGQECAQ